MISKYLAYLVLTAAFLVLVFVPNSVSQTGFAYYEAKSKKKLGELQVLDQEIERQQTYSQDMLKRYGVVEKHYKEAEEDFNKAENDHKAALQAMHVMTNERFQQVQNIFRQTQGQLQAAEIQLKDVHAEKEHSLKELRRLQQLGTSKQIELLESQAQAYDAKMEQGVWAIGEGESVLDENKTSKEARTLAMKYAIRDATEKGGKLLVESITEVSMFKLVKDEIRAHAKVQVVEQDNSADYGKAKRIVSGDLIKYVAKVRLKLRSVSEYNPYRERLRNLESQRPITSDDILDGKKSPKIVSLEDSQTVVKEHRKQRKSEAVGIALLYILGFIVFFGLIGIGIRYGMLEDHFREKQNKLREEAKRTFDKLEALENEQVGSKAEAEKRLKMWSFYLTEHKKADYRLSDARMYNSVYESWAPPDN